MRAREREGEKERKGFALLKVGGWRSLVRKPLTAGQKQRESLRERKKLREEWTETRSGKRERGRGGRRGRQGLRQWTETRLGKSGRERVTERLRQENPPPKNPNLYPGVAPGVGGQQSTTHVARNTSLRQRFQPLETGVTTGSNTLLAPRAPRELY